MGIVSPFPEVFFHTVDHAVICEGDKRWLVSTNALAARTDCFASFFVKLIAQYHLFVTETNMLTAPSCASDLTYS